MSKEYIVGIDPGKAKTGICRIEFLPELAHNANIVEALLIPNHAVRPYLEDLAAKRISYYAGIEGLVSYGAVWGDDTIRTAYFIGRLLTYFEDDAEMRTKFDLFSRKQYGQWITDGKITKDANVRSALETTYGSFKKTGPLAALVGPTSDKRSAFAVAKYYEYRLIEQAKGNTTLPESLYRALETEEDE